MAGKILIHKDRPEQHLLLVDERVGIEKVACGFSLSFRRNVLDDLSLKAINLDWYKKSAEEKNEDFIWIDWILKT